MRSRVSLRGKLGVKLCVSESDKRHIQVGAKPNVDEQFP